MEASHLARLPAEIRAEIWTTALQHDNPIEVDHFGHQTSDDRAGKPDVLALSRTCKAMNRECTKMFYAVNEMTIHINPLESTTEIIKRLVQQLGAEKCALLKTLYLYADLGSNLQAYTEEYTDNYLVEAKRWFKSPRAYLKSPRVGAETKFEPKSERDIAVLIKMLHHMAWIDDELAAADLRARR